MNARRMILINVILLIILVGGGFTGYYFYNKSVTYLSTDNAQIAGQQVAIASPAAGKLVTWNAKVGERFNKGDKVGTVQVMGDKGVMNVDITAPADGTVVQSNGVKDTFVGAGTPIAQSYDLDNLWITANIKETDINDVKVGQDVDVYVDAYPNSNLSGKVKTIGLATAGTFSLLPSNNASGNYTKEVQVIPVKISIENYGGLDLVPGMNVTVRIHK
ncbi:HlyD family efflux transporter periplasmic adaptor subunit [Bacillus sp. FJAT-49736]|uniref:efflux RND transporter periplasmic adaptor subunit n=1 Tax=Bacillus sp. FJAT-49736 TaxID=2833582 RepID=UPI001BC99202|nr:HlyD family efflux transporter periplasmic adaptor subunit [Bacillus sp. FJAT-49736]MBS4173624.1 HlyD family secretion protein [Bacillus sp. FJAT-49736]